MLSPARGPAAPPGRPQGQRLTICALSRPREESAYNFWPDLHYIRTHISIRDVARELGLEVRGTTARCWRTENHRNGDADPTVRFLVRKNRGRCFLCDDKGAWSVIDLVVMVRNCGLKQALAWICERYVVPAAPRGKHLNRRESWRPNYRVGVTGSPLEPLVRSGLWSKFTPTQQAVLPVLTSFRDPETGRTEISYGGLLRYAGVGSRASVAKALRHFCRIGLLSVERGLAQGGVRAVNRYQLDFENDRLLWLMNEFHRQKRAEIEAERAFRAEARARRRNRASSHATCTGTSTQFTGCTDAQFHGSTSEPRSFDFGPFGAVARRQ